MKRIGSPIHIECKLKTWNSKRASNIVDAFKKGTERVKTFIEELNVFGDVRIVFRSDPSEEAISDVVEKIGSELRSGRGVGKRFQKDGVKIDIVPYKLPHPFLPNGYDYAWSQGRVIQSKANGEPIIGDLWSIAWRCLEPMGWVKSALSSLKQAAKQLHPKGPI